jgi:hypothetical protein
MCCAAAAPVLCCNAMYCFNALCRFADAVPTLGAERFVTHASAGGVIWAFPVCLLVCLVLMVMAYVWVCLLISRLSPVHDRWRLVELRWYIDRPHAPAHICTGTGLTPATSAPGQGSPLPHLQSGIFRCPLHARGCLLHVASAASAAVNLYGREVCWGLPEVREVCRLTTQSTRVLRRVPEWRTVPVQTLPLVLREPHVAELSHVHTRTRTHTHARPHARAHRLRVLVG